MLKIYFYNFKFWEKFIKKKEKYYLIIYLFIFKQKKIKLKNV